MKQKFPFCCFIGALVITLCTTVLPGSTTTYTYDSLNRLITVDYGNGTTIAYTYDAAGNRLTRTTVVAPVARPDLTGSWISLTQTCKVSRGISKCSLSGAFLLKNQGTQNAPISTVKFFLSREVTFDEGEILLSTVQTALLGPGRTKQLKLKVTLQPGVSASGKFVLAVVDPADTLAESNETNNMVVFGPIP